MAQAENVARSWPGLEKFNLVQDHLEKNKYVDTHLGCLACGCAFRHAFLFAFIGFL